MHNFNLTDETFDVNQSNNYHLLMQSGLEGFSYAICDSVRNKCILLKHYEGKSADWYEYKNFLQTVVDGDPNLKLHFKASKHIINHKDFTLVPEDFIPQDEQQRRAFFPGISGNLTSSVSKASKSVIIFPYPQTLHEALLKSFPGALLSHISLPFIQNLIHESSRTLRHVFHFMVYDGFLIGGVAHSARLDFVNAFKVETFEDILYFMISILEKFNGAPSFAEIYVQNNSVIVDLNSRLQTYIGKARNLKASHGMVYSYIFTEDILERFANLLNLYHCEL